MQKKSNSKKFKVMKWTPKINSSHYLLSSTFNDKFLKISSWYSIFEYLAQQYRAPWKKKIPSKQHFATSFRCLTKK